MYCHEGSILLPLHRKRARCANAKYLSVPYAVTICYATTSTPHTNAHKHRSSILTVSHGSRTGYIPSRQVTAESTGFVKHLRGQQRRKRNVTWRHTSFFSEKQHEHKFTTHPYLAPAYFTRDPCPHPQTRPNTSKQIARQYSSTQTNNSAAASK
jgi:hypothetical protein